MKQRFISSTAEAPQFTEYNRRLLYQVCRSLLWHGPVVTLYYPILFVWHSFWLWVILIFWWLFIISNLTWYSAIPSHHFIVTFTYWFLTSTHAYHSLILLGMWICSSELFMLRSEFTTVAHNFDSIIFVCVQEVQKSPAAITLHLVSKDKEYGHRLYILTRCIFALYLQVRMRRHREQIVFVLVTSCKIIGLKKSREREASVWCVLRLFESCAHSTIEYGLTDLYRCHCYSKMNTICRTLPRHVNVNRRQVWQVRTSL